VLVEQSEFHPLVSFVVTPAKAGVQGNRLGLGALDSRCRGNDVLV